ncbi:hypothetical protein A3A09_00675 [Candidatus Nomurabacteria bacterium RIFCSPLOWO2_01_FULL_42_20]|uniref:LamG-like jellyroll fold domain-containing protein n=1 Tax=Candidatus Nomurabacteria bacterium RIFCSPHIGHO2_01_FULL_42_16 TaxID=1801743 RepID=A0A1F6VLQ1_9BACT|nr:MAG: hypothetical protein A2824_02190 [Candidatus Nomurabacteria bacterium RIFCSPHIGHO2_01_FULL_42_16]OGI92282.1 MAG: hypothetical protein A3A09_00675 [Candidatus Nomurabacteria bacterium RIFCSPLOWO2_01_FULL_42_20]
MALAIVVSLFAFAVNTADAQAGPFSHWGFNEGSGTNALDSVDANNGTIYGGALYDPNNKIEGTHSLLLNGVNNYVGLFEPPANSTNLYTGTLGAWIKTDNAGSSFRGIFLKQLAYSMFLNNNEFGLYDWSGGGWRGSGTFLNDNNWHYVAVTFQSGVTNGTILYIDGVAKVTTTMTVLSQSEGVVMGAGNNPGTVQFFKGNIDNVKIYNSVLTAFEILGEYTQNAPFQITTSSLPPNTIGVSASHQLIAVGGTPPYTWGPVSGTLPPGMTLSPSGVFSGIPTTGGVFNFTVTATDNSSPVKTATKQLKKNVRPAWPGGDGTPGNPFQITGCELLQAMEENLVAYYKLNNSIDCSDTVNWDNGAGFKPIGKTDLEWPFSDTFQQFTGSFDGMGFTISNLFVNRPGENSAALFGFTNNFANIKNVTLENFDLTGGCLNSGCGVATLIGFTYRTSILNVNVIGGNFEGIRQVGSAVGNLFGSSSATNVHAENVTVTSTQGQSGGLFGRVQDGSVVDRSSSRNATAFGTVGGQVAAFVGNCLRSTIRNSYTTGGIIITTAAGGGFTGGDSGCLIENTYAVASVTSSGSGGHSAFVQFFSGAVGIARNSWAATAFSGSTRYGFARKGSSPDCDTGTFWDADVSGPTTAGCGTGKTTAQMTTQSTFVGYDFASTWKIVPHPTTGLPSYPCLQWQANATCVWPAIPSDTTPPTVAIVSPTADDILTSTTVTVTGTASDDVGVTGVTVNGVNATTSDNFANWTATVSVTLPANVGDPALNFTATATDAANNSASDTKLVDNDGIDAVVDTDDNFYSNTFTDGVTNGTVTARSGWTLHISDITTNTPKTLGTFSVTENGVQAIITGSGTANATINTCHTFPTSSSPETVILKANNDTGNITCVTTSTGTNNTTMLTAVQAATSLSLKKGLTTINLSTGQTGGAGSPFMAAKENELNINKNIEWKVTNQTTNYTYMTGVLVPNDAKDIDFTGTEEAPESITVKNLTANITNTFTSDSDTITLSPGDVFTDQCLGVGGNTGNTGCPFAKKVTVGGTLINMANKTTVQFPPVGGTIRLFPRQYSSTALEFQNLDNTFENGPKISECVISSVSANWGECTLGVPTPAQYFVIAKFATRLGNFYGGLPNYENSFGADGLARERIHGVVIIRPDGQTIMTPGLVRIFTGSLLEIVEPALLEIENGINYVPFVYETPDQYWQIVTNFTPPSGCTSDISSYEDSIADGMKSAVFTLSCDTSQLADSRRLYADGRRLVAQVGATVSQAAKVSHHIEDCTKKNPAGKTVCRPQTVSSVIEVLKAAGKPAGGKPLSAGNTSLWKMVEQKYNNGPTSVANKVIEIAKANDIAIPEWGIAGRIDSRSLSASAIESLLR